MLFTDSHAHLYDERFEQDLDTVIQNSINEGIHRMIVPSTGIENHQKVVCLCEKYSECCFPSYGLHPTTVNESKELENELIALENILTEQQHKAVAVGEAGLDLYWSKDFIEQQLYAFRAQCQMAKKFDLPIIIHCRDSFEPLHSELAKIGGEIKGVIHGFSGSEHDYQMIKRYGNFKFGIGGVVTYKNSTLKEVVAKMELEDIILETDAPYLPPVPFRGKRNEPKHVRLIAEYIAQLQGCKLEEISQKSEENCRSLFKKIER